MLGTVRTRQSTHPPVHARDLEDVVLQDDEGRDVRLGDLWQEQAVALILLRHYGCVFCRQHAVQLHRARRAFEAAGVRLVVTGQGTPSMAAEFRDAQSIELPLLVDPDRLAYPLAGTKVATLDELYAPRILLRGLKHTLLSRLRQGSIAVNPGPILGHNGQLGGVLIIATDGSVRYAHLSKDASDNPPTREVLAAARAIRPRAATS